MNLFWAITSLLSGYALSLLLIPWVLLTKQRNPTSTIAWILAILVLPVVGGVLFLFFGINTVDRRTANRQDAYRNIGPQVSALSSFDVASADDDKLSDRQRNLMRLATNVSGTSATIGNNIDVIANTSRTLTLIEEAIANAQNTIHLEYYIWQPDRIGTKLRDILIARANEGVRIRFLYDFFGSLWLNRRFIKPMRAAGIEVASFLPGASLRERWSLNLRNHRKIIIVDGHVGFTGGMNIGDEYVGRDPAFGRWRDTHLRLTGPAVHQLQQIFVEDWHFATGQELTQPELFPDPVTNGATCAHVVPAGPDNGRQAFHALMFSAINEARDQILLTTSYFVPTPPLLTALETAVWRGVRVRLLVPAGSQFWWTVWAGRSYYETLLAAGVEIHEYQDGMLHAKTLTIDGDWSLVGSPNFDTRSLILNFEAGAVLYDRRIAKQLEEQFEADLKHAKPITPDAWRNRPLWRVAGENVCRLFSPVM